MRVSEYQGEYLDWESFINFSLAYIAIKYYTRYILFAYSHGDH